MRRSTLALKSLVHSPSGAIAAAATTSLPEDVRGGKNWDYRFAWVRDLAYSVDAFLRFGLREEPHAAVSWVLKALKANTSDGIAVFLSLDGRAGRRRPSRGRGRVAGDRAGRVAATRRAGSCSWGSTPT